MRKQNRSQSRRAFTLIELCLALIITALIASATSAMMVTVARYWDHGTQLDKNASAISQLTGRLQRIFQNAKCLGQFQTGDSSTATAAIAFWLRDDNSDGKMQQSELTVVRFNPGLHRLELYGAYPTSPAASDGSGGSVGIIGGGINSGGGGVTVGGGSSGGGTSGGGGSSGGSTGSGDVNWTLADLRASTAISNIIAAQSARTLLNHVTAATVDVTHLDETSVTPVVTWNVQLEDDGDGFRQPMIISLRGPLAPG